MNEKDAHTAYDPELWSRVGGREFQFFATDSEVTEWLLTALPEQYAPYDLISRDMEREGEIYVRQPVFLELSALPASVQRSLPGRWRFYIRSEVLTPQLPLRRGESVDAICLVNGLVELTHGLMRHDRQDVSRIAVIDKVRHRLTGEFVRHAGYLEVYQALRKQIKKAVRYTTIWIYPDGRELADEQLAPWTEGAAQECESGALFVARPGRPLEKGSTTRKR